MLKECDNKVKISVDLRELNPARTFLCGQCFRWRELADGGFEGIAHGRRLTASVEGETAVIGDFPESEERLWREYFDLDTDYSEYIERLSADETLAKACRASAGIHILRQDPFETLISFIISQNNNIPRISGIVGRLCESFGEKIDAENPVITANSTNIAADVVENAENVKPRKPNGGEKIENFGNFNKFYAFPTAERLRGIEAGDLALLRAGFRARYIADAVEKVNSGFVDFDEIDALPLDKAREKLKTIVGVGDKVADCVLLFAFRKLDAFPRDVWVKRIMAQYYPNGLPDCAKGIEGVAQQYLFDYVRNLTEKVSE